MLDIIDTVGIAIGYNFYRLDLIENKQERLSVRAVFIAILKEEGYRNRDIIYYADGWNQQSINYAHKIFNDFIVTDKLTKEIYLKAVKAVEELSHESKNEPPAA